MNVKKILNNSKFKIEIIYDDLSLRTLVSNNLDYLKRYLDDEFKSSKCLSILVTDIKTNEYVYSKQKTDTLINLLKMNGVKI